MVSTSLSPDDRLLGVLPFFHAYGLTVCVLMSLTMGATIHLYPRFETKPVPVVPDPPGTYAPADPKVGVAASGTTLKLPDERNGLIFVFRVFEKMSYAMVMSATRPIYIGDVVQTP